LAASQEGLSSMSEWVSELNGRNKLQWSHHCQVILWGGLTDVGHFVSEMIHARQWQLSSFAHPANNSTVCVFFIISSQQYVYCEGRHKESHASMAAILLTSVVSILYTLTPQKDSADFAIFLLKLPSEGKIVYVITTVMFYHKSSSFLRFGLSYLFNNSRLAIWIMASSCLCVFPTNKCWIIWRTFVWNQYRDPITTDRLILSIFAHLIIAT
jgi:hypothetical protein